MACCPVSRVQLHRAVRRQPSRSHRRRLLQHLEVKAPRQAIGPSSGRNASNPSYYPLMPSVVAYHGVTAAEHQARVNDLAPRGYRPTSLSVSGAPDDAPYAAVWIERPGPAWVAVHGFTGAQYQTRVDGLTSQG